MIEIDKPTLFLDLDKCRRNIVHMHRKCLESNVVLQPHFKTHQSRFIGAMYKEAGVKAITVSSVCMAEYFANDGWDDITIAFPCNVYELPAINDLCASGVKLTVLVDNMETIKMLGERITYSLKVRVELDVGYGRTGIQWEDHQAISNSIKELSKEQFLDFTGFYIHSGHSYYCRGEDDVKNLFQQCTDRLRSVSEKFPGFTTCYGDTPTCSIASSFNHIEFVSAGNFVFYDLTQTQIGSCTESQIAVAMACPVVSINKNRNEVCIYGGGVHFSKDAVQYGDHKCYGKIVKFNKDGWTSSIDGCYVSSISQEHGVVHLSSEEMEQVTIGDILGILPVHSCMTAEAMGQYFTLEGIPIDHFAQKNRDTPGFLND